MTTSVTVFVLLQPLVVPVSVYVVLLVGFTTATAVVILPGSQVKVAAPEAVNVAEPPRQIAVGLTDAFTVGVIFTLTVTKLVLVQPFVLPLTVYVVFAVGVTTTLLFVAPPGNQV